MKKLEIIIRRIFFYGAFVLAAIAACEKIANQFKYRLLRGAYTPQELLELATIGLIFYIAMQLHQIRLQTASKPNEPKK
jgi:preprotein translocase subunit SecY